MAFFVCIGTLGVFGERQANQNFTSRSLLILPSEKQASIK